MPHAVGAVFREAKPCPEMLSVHSEPALEVFQVTSDPSHDVHCAAMHSSFALFTPDSHRCVLERQNGLGRGSDWKMEFLLCDLEDRFSLRLLSDEARVRGPVLSRDGRVLYYWDDQTGADKPRLVFKQIDLGTFRRDTLLVIDSPVHGLGRAPRGGQMYDMSSLRRDGKRLAASCSFFGDGDQRFGTFVVDLETMRAHGFWLDPTNWRPNGLYYRGDDPRFLDHMLVCAAGGITTGGKWHPHPDDLGRITLHIITDEGRRVAAVPIGDKGEGVDHPAWRGGRYEVVTHTSSTNTAPHWRCVPLAHLPAQSVPTRLGDRYSRGHRPESPEGYHADGRQEEPHACLLKAMSSQVLSATLAHRKSTHSLSCSWPQFLGSIFNSKTSSLTSPVAWLFQ